MSDEYSDDTDQFQQAAQTALDLASEVNAEFGWHEVCEDGVSAAELLYEEHGPFELKWPYGITKREWYGGAETPQDGDSYE